MTLDRLSEDQIKLHAGGFKLTPQREATIAILLEHQARRLSTEEVLLLYSIETLTKLVLA